VPSPLVLLLRHKRIQAHRRRTKPKSSQRPYEEHPPHLRKQCSDKHVSTSYLCLRCAKPVCDRLSRSISAAWALLNHAAAEKGANHRVILNRDLRDGERQRGVSARYRKLVIHRPTAVVILSILLRVLRVLLHRLVSISEDE
jgi:hypothetical protein